MSDREWRLEIRGLDNPQKKMDWERIKTLNASWAKCIAEKMKNVNTATRIRGSWEERKLEEQMKEINDSANNGNEKTCLVLSRQNKKREEREEKHAYQTG